MLMNNVYIYFSLNSKIIKINGPCASILSFFTMISFRMRWCSLVLIQFVSGVTTRSSAYRQGIHGIAHVCSFIAALIHCVPFYYYSIYFQERGVDNSKNIKSCHTCLFIVSCLNDRLRTSIMAVFYKGCYTYTTKYEI